MGILRKLADLFVFSNLFVAFAVACLTLQTVILAIGEADIRYPLFVFFSTLFLYNFHRVFRLNARSENELKERRHSWIKENKFLFISIFIFATIGLAFVTFKYIYFVLFIFLIPVVIISFGYSIPVIPLPSGWIRLRDIPLLKIFLITFVLSWVTVLIPFWFHAFETTGEWNFDAMSYEGLWYAMGRRMLFIFAITIPFDIRDIEHDSHNKLKTIPVLLGVKASVIISQIALLLFILLVIMEAMKNSSWIYASALISSAVITGILITLANRSRKEYFYTFVIEGTMILQFVLVYITWQLSL